MSLWRFRSPMVSFGHETILGFLAANYPEFLRSLENPVVDTQRFGKDLVQAHCRRYHQKPTQVPSPAAVQAAGPVGFVNEYPLELLEGYFERAVKLATLKAKHAYTTMMYVNSTWSSGPGYRKQLDIMGSEIAKLTGELQEFVTF